MVESAQVVIVDGLQTQTLQSGTLLPVMHNIAQAIENPLLKFLFGFGDSTGYPKAKAAMLVDRDYCCNVVMIIVVML